MLSLCESERLVYSKTHVFAQVKLRMNFHGETIVLSPERTSLFPLSTDSTGEAILNRAADIRAQRISFLFVPIQRVQCQNVWMLLQPFSTPPGKGLCEKHGEINIPSSKSVYPPTVYLVKPVPLKTQGGLTCAAFTCRCESSVYHCLKSVVRPLTPPRTFQGKQNNWQLQQKTSSLPSTGLS